MKFTIKLSENVHGKLENLNNEISEILLIVAPHVDVDHWDGGLHLRSKWQVI